MTDLFERADLTELREQIERITPDADSFVAPQATPEPPTDRGAFGRWLLRQDKRDSLIGELAKCAKRDPAFPAGGDAEAVRKRLSELQAEGDMFEALDDAELDWLAL